MDRILPYSVSDFSVFVTDRIKTYMSEDGERIFPTVSDRFHPYSPVATRSCREPEEYISILLKTYF
jgi:hypothetical protein